jgi:hypothetical protein
VATSMQAHSLLWHYLWLGPQVLQIVLAVFLWHRGLHRRFPAFVTYLVFEAAEAITLYGMDVLPQVSGRTWWLTFCVGLVIEGFIRLAVIGELFLHLLRDRPAIAKVGSRLISVMGAVLVLLAASAATFAPLDRQQFAIGYRAHILQQTLYLIECGLIVFLFLFAAYFRLTWDKATLGIGLGRGISSAVHLATWAVMANGVLPHKFLDFAPYHLCVLIWFYYLLVPQKKATTSAVSLPENSLATWNRELERLLQP